MAAPRTAAKMKASRSLWIMRVAFTINPLSYLPGSAPGLLSIGDQVWERWEAMRIRIML